MVNRVRVKILRRKDCVFCGAKNKFAALTCRVCRNPFPAYQALIAGALLGIVGALLAVLILFSD